MIPFSEIQVLPNMGHQTPGKFPGKARVFRGGLEAFLGFED